MELRELRTAPHLSASGVSDYIDCGLLYKLARIDRVSPDFRSDALEFGSAIHLTLGGFYQERLTGNNLPLKSVQDNFEWHWRDLAEDNDDIRYDEDKDFESLLMLGKELLAVWYEKLPEDNFRVVGIEEAFSFNIPGLEVPIIGAMDLIEEDESGTLIITDWKTSGRAYSSDEVDKNMQLTLYQMAAKANGFQGREILLRFDCLIKTKTRKFEQYWTTRSETDERRVSKKILQVWDGIRKGVFIPNDTHWKCGGCAYKTACEEWFEKGDGKDE